MINLHLNFSGHSFIEFSPNIATIQFIIRTLFTTKNSKNMYIFKILILFEYYYTLLIFIQDNRTKFILDLSYSISFRL